MNDDSNLERSYEVIAHQLVRGRPDVTRCLLPYLIDHIDEVEDYSAFTALEDKKKDVEQFEIS